MNVVKPLKNATETSAELFGEPIDPTIDGLACAGAYPQSGGSMDDLVGIERDSTGQLILKDPVAGSRKLAQLLASGGSVVLYDSAGLPMAVKDGIAIPGSTSALLIAGRDSSGNARVPVLLSSAPTGTEYGLVTRPIPSGTQTVAPAGGAMAIAGTVAVSNLPATQSVTALALPLPAGAAQDATLTSGSQRSITRGGAKGSTAAADVTSASIDANTQALHVAIAGTPTVAVQAFPAVQQVVAAALPLPAGAATAAKQPQPGTAGAPGADILTVQGAPAMTPIAVAGTVSVGNLPASQAVTGTVNVGNLPAVQQVSAAVLPLPAGAAQDATLTGGSQRSVVRGGGKGSTAASDVTSASVDANTQALHVAVTGTASVAGTVTANQGTAGAAAWKVDASSSTSLPLPTGAATEATIAGRLPTQGQKTMAASMPVAIASDQTPMLLRAIDSAGNPVAASSGSTLPATQGGNVMAGSDGVSARLVRTDSQGHLLTVPATTSSTSGVTGGFADGTTSTNSAGIFPINETTYTEQTSSGAVRQVASSSAADSAAGTGARTITITYFDDNLNGPYTETVTLNGGTPVNTVNTNIRFIEKVVVASVGSAGKNAGTISIRASALVVIGSINVGDNRTFWAHHYVSSGKTFTLTSIDGSASANGSTASVFARSGNPLDSSVPERQFSSTIRLSVYTWTIQRVYPTPIQVTGPARIRMYVNVDSAGQSTYWSSFDFSEGATGN